MSRKLLIYLLMLGLLGCADSTSKPPAPAVPADEAELEPASEVESKPAVPADDAKLEPASGAESKPPAPTWKGKPPDGPPPAIAPFNAETAKEHQQAWATYLELPVERELELAEDVRMKLVFIPPGEFQMGSPATEVDRDEDEDQVAVTLTQGFYLGETEVTQAQWTAVMGTEPWSGETYFKEGPAYAANYISWDDAAEFCTKLTEQEQAAGRLAKGWRYALPSVAQREYACRAGTTTAYYFGDDPAQLGDYAWFYNNADGIGEKYAHEVRLKKPNAWTLFDMHGNVLEWVRDMHQNELPGGIDPLVLQGSSRVSRGGSWSNPAWICRSAFRFWSLPSARYDSLGFRLAAVPVGGASPEPASEAGSESR